MKIYFSWYLFFFSRFQMLFSAEMVLLHMTANVTFIEVWYQIEVCKKLHMTKMEFKTVVISLFPGLTCYTEKYSSYINVNVLLYVNIDCMYASIFLPRWLHVCIKYTCSVCKSEPVWTPITLAMQWMHVPMSPHNYLVSLTFLDEEWSNEERAAGGVRVSSFKKHRYI